MTNLNELVTVGEARERYFRENGLSEAGYAARWVRLQAVPLPMYFPNTRSRVRAVRLHDLHHIATGYGTSWIGEAEIGAWELAAGCGRHYAAWLLNLSVLPLGLVLSPRRIWQAWRRGRRARTLYSSEFHPALLELTLDELQARLELL